MRRMSRGWGYGAAPVGSEDGCGRTARAGGGERRCCGWLGSGEWRRRSPDGCALHHVEMGMGNRKINPTTRYVNKKINPQSQGSERGFSQCASKLQRALLGRFGLGACIHSTPQIKVLFSSSQNSTPSTKIPTLQNTTIHTTSTTRMPTYMHTRWSIWTWSIDRHYLQQFVTSLFIQLYISCIISKLYMMRAWRTYTTRPDPSRRPIP
jgi:hypothetical protein